MPTDKRSTSAQTSAEQGDAAPEAASTRSPKVRARSSWVFYVGLCGALAASLFDLYWTHELTGGLRWILHNPGSCFFHFVLFPPVMGLTLFLAYQSVGSIRGFWHELFIAAFVLVFTVITLRAFMVDSKEVDEHRIIEPSDLGTDSLRNRALAVDAILRGIAIEPPPSGGSPAATPEEVLAMLSAEATSDELAALDRVLDGVERGVPIAAADRVAAAGARLKERVYRSVVDATMSSSGPGAKRRFSTLTDGSVCAKMGRVLSGIAAVSGFLLLFSTVCLAARHAQMKLYHKEIAICTAAFSLWLPMRIYSEYYNGYGHLSLEHFKALYIVAAAVFVVAIVVAVVAGDTLGAKVAGLATNLLGAVVVLFVREYDAEFSSYASQIASLDDPTFLSIQACFGLGAVLCVLLLLGD